MNKAEIIEQYINFMSMHDLKPTEFVLSAGGVCVLLGLRETTRDLDMDIREDIYIHYKPLLKFEKPGSQTLMWNEVVMIHVLEEGETVVIDGVCCYTPQRVLEQKLRLNRPKDQADIAGLKRLLR